MNKNEKVCSIATFPGKFFVLLTSLCFTVCQWILVQNFFFHQALGFGSIYGYEWLMSDDCDYNTEGVSNAGNSLQEEIFLCLNSTLNEIIKLKISICPRDIFARNFTSVSFCMKGS